MAKSTVKKKVVKIDDDPRWLKAVNFFIKDGAGDAGQAMIEAGFPKSTAKGKCQLLRKHPAYLEWVKAKSKKNLITKELLNEKLLRWANSNVVDYFNFGDYAIPKGKDDEDNEYRYICIKNLTELPREITDCITEIQETGHGIRIKLIDKLAAVAKLAEINGLIAPKQSEVTGKDGKPIKVEFGFGDANLKPYIPDTKNRMAKYN